MKGVAVEARKLSKAYRLYDRPSDRLREILHGFRKRYHREFYALEESSFEIRQGECLGIVGSNGSGKSTLLKMIAGVLTPTSGSLEIHGRVSALLELGVGFNPDMSGVENLYFNGAIMGRKRHEMDGKIAEIQAFADLGEFMRQPVRTYSAGMFMRLAFASAINVDPDILIIDEALAVGDARFQQKCYRKIREFRERGKTILLVSHDMGAITSLCDRTFWLKGNTLHRAGEPNQIVREYVSSMTYDAPTAGGRGNGRAERASASASLGESDIPWEDTSALSSFGEGGAQITRVAAYLRSPRRRAAVLQGGEDVTAALDIRVLADIPFPIVGIILKDEYGNNMVGINTAVYGTIVRPLSRGERLVVEFAFRFPPLKNGHYALSMAIGEGTLENHRQHHWVHDAVLLEVANDDPKHRMGCYFVADHVKIKVP